MSTEKREKEWKNAPGAVSAEALKLSDDLKELVGKLFDALEKKQKCLEYEDKCLDKIEEMLAKAAPHIFWEEDSDYIQGTYSGDESEEDLIDATPTKIITSKKIPWNKKK